MAVTFKDFLYGFAQSVPKIIDSYYQLLELEQNRRVSESQINYYTKRAELTEQEMEEKKKTLPFTVRALADQEKLNAIAVNIKTKTEQNEIDKSAQELRRVITEIDANIAAMDEAKRTGLAADQARELDAYRLAALKDSERAKVMALVLYEANPEQRAQWEKYQKENPNAGVADYLQHAINSGLDLQDPYIKNLKMSVLPQLLDAANAAKEHNYKFAQGIFTQLNDPEVDNKVKQALRDSYGIEKGDAPDVTWNKINATVKIWNPIPDALAEWKVISDYATGKVSTLMPDTPVLEFSGGMSLFKEKPPTPSKYFSEGGSGLPGVAYDVGKKIPGALTATEMGIRRTGNILFPQVQPGINKIDELYNRGAGSILGRQ